jgi:uncharacterized protein YqjF (DUF2071 family)
VLEETTHRPWPVPRRTWLQAQTWDHLLFAHWRVDAQALRALVPASIPIDTFDGSAWLGITPFRLSGLRLRGMLPVPVASSFLELNVRTYATIDDRPGIWFFSLDAESSFAVQAAKRAYRLPYHYAQMSAGRRGDWVDYRSARADARFDASFRPTGAEAAPRAGTLEHFLTERYCLYTVHEGGVHRADIHHPPWPLQGAEAEFELNTIPPDGLEVRGEPLLHYSTRQDTLVWPLRRVSAQEP